MENTFNATAENAPLSAGSDTRPNELRACWKCMGSGMPTNGAQVLGLCSEHLQERVRDVMRGEGEACPTTT